MIQYFLFYISLYGIICYSLTGYYKDLSFKILSTYNAINCIKLIFLINKQCIEFLYPGTDNIIDGMYLFAAYLLVDGTANLLTVKKKDNAAITSIIHHFVGGVGIFLIAYLQIGIGLGLYFAFTEISTPLLNLSWLLHANDIKVKQVFILFFYIFFISRILTIPILLIYIYHNITNILQMSWPICIMTYVASGIVSSLNIVWYVMLSKKMKELD